MATIDSDLMFAGKPVVTCAEAGQVVAVNASASAPATLAADDIIRLAKIPAGYVVDDIVLRSTDLDTGTTPAITISVGILNADGDDLVSGTTFITDSTVAQAGGIARMAAKSSACTTAQTSEQIVAAKVTTAAATKAAGTVGATVKYFQP